MSFMPDEKYVMISLGRELLVIEIMGVTWSNCRMSDVAEIPSILGITISYIPRIPGQDKFDLLATELKGAHHQYQVIFF